MSAEDSKKRAALEALTWLDDARVIGIGTGSTVNHFIDALKSIKGGGGALTREKIVAAVSKQFICIVDDSKLVDVLGHFPLPVEVIPMARSYVARELVKLGGLPDWRSGFTTDNGNHILDVHGLTILDPPALEAQINQITGVVNVGLFARRPADVLLVGYGDRVEKITR